MLTAQNFKIKRLNGEIIDLYSKGITVLGFRDQAPESEDYEETAEWIEGYYDQGSTLKRREIDTSMYIESRDFTQHTLDITKLFRIFNSAEPFYLIRDAQPGKQILVRRSGGLVPSLEPGYSAEIDITFKSLAPYWESIADTREPIDFTSHLWAIGMGFDTSKTYQYKFSGQTSFAIFNPGDAVLNPRIHNRPLIIEFRGASNNLTIKNNTTGETFTYWGQTVPGDILRIEDVRVFKNGLSVYGNTNRQLLSIALGENRFSISGASGAFEIEFINKFYYF